MITVKTLAELEIMRKASKIVASVLELLQENAIPGITTRRLDNLAYDYIKKAGASPSFLGYNGYPATICASIDEEVVHGIPSNRVLEEGMLLKVDVGACFQGFHGDAARTVLIGQVTPEKARLAKICKESFFKGIEAVKDGARLGDLGSAIQTFVEREGYGVVRSLVGHGIGREMHEDPNVPNYGTPGRGFRLKENMTIAIEPMINMGTHAVEMLSDGWTIVTADRKPSAHYENTVIVKADGVEILTM